MFSALCVAEGCTFRLEYRVSASQLCYLGKAQRLRRKVQERTLIALSTSKAIGAAPRLRRCCYSQARPISQSRRGAANYSIPHRSPTSSSSAPVWKAGIVPSAAQTELLGTAGMLTQRMHIQKELDGLTMICKPFAVTLPNSARAPERRPLEELH